LKTANLVTAATTGWARVEGQKHYPSDILAGACLGNFITTFIHDAFLNLPEDSTFSFYLEPSPRELFISVCWSF
jgi:membrane-associated phospholipid phosphatase